MSILGSEIDDLKGVFSKRQGAANVNRFMIFMQPPSASLLNLDVNAAITGALSGNLSIGGFINDPRDVSLLCESCTLPGRAITTMEKQNVKQAVKVPYSFVNEDVTFTFILTGDYYMRKMFDNWLELVFDTNKYEMRYPDTYTTDIRIAQLNKQNIPVYTVKLEKAYPTTINAISLDNTAENSIQKVSVNVTYENFVVEGFLDSVTGIAKGALGSVTKLF
jgi:hypothetical protein